MKNENDNKENIDINDKIIIQNKENKKINNNFLNYNYGDNVDTETLNEISNSNIKININDNFNIINNEENIEKSYNNKILNINYNIDKETALNNSNNLLKPVKSYNNLYNEFKRKYNITEKIDNKLNNYSQQSIYKNYINSNIHRNYLNSNNESNNFNYSMFIKEIKTPLRNEYHYKLNNNNNYTDYKKNSFTPNNYFKLNNADNDIYASNIKERLIYLEKKLEEYKKEKLNYINEINIYKNSLQTISEFFSFISKNFLPGFFPKDKNIQINNENILYIYFKNLEEYISKLNKELNDYKYKYEKLLDIDSNRPSLSTKNTLIINKQTKEYKTQNNSFSEFCDNTANSILDNNISNKENEIYKSLEKRITLLEKELLDKKIREKSGQKILNNKKEIKKNKINNENNDISNNNDTDRKYNRVKYLSYYKSNLNSKNNKNKIINLKKNKVYKNEKYKKK